MRKITYGPFYRTYLLSNCSEKKRELGFYEDILDCINDFLCCCREHNSKIYFLQYVLKFPSAYSNSHMDGNAILSKFLEAVTRRYKRLMPSREYHPSGQEKISLPLYFWVREQSNTGEKHYHLVMAFDGHRVESPHKINHYVYKRWNKYFSSELGIAPVDFGYSRLKNGWSQYEDLFKYGGLMIKHYQDHQTVVETYRKLFTVLSYYAKVYSKVQSNVPGRKPRNHGCSLKIPQYNEIVYEVDARIRGELESNADHRLRCGGSALPLQFDVYEEDARYQKKIIRSIDLLGITKYENIANTRQAHDVVCWVTECGTYRFSFFDNETIFDGENGPDVLLVDGPGVEYPFTNIAKSHPKHSSKYGYYEGVIWGEQVEIKIDRISGKLRYVDFVRIPDHLIERMKEKGYYGGNNSYS